MVSVLELHMSGFGVYRDLAAELTYRGGNLLNLPNGKACDSHSALTLAGRDLKDSFQRPDARNFVD
jgi:hypothetical protein